MSKITCDFILTGQGYDPAAITRELGIQPTRTWHKGERITSSLLHYKHDGWLLRNGPIESLDLQEAAQPLLDRLLPLADKIAHLRSQLHVETELSFCVYLSQQMPAIHFDRITLDTLHQLQAEIDIDLYP